MSLVMPDRFVRWIDATTEHLENPDVWLEVTIGSGEDRRVLGFVHRDTFRAMQAT